MKTVIIIFLFISSWISGKLWMYLREYKDIVIPPLDRIMKWSLFSISICTLVAMTLITIYF